MSDRDARHGEGLASGHRYERRTVAYIGRAAGLSRWHCGSGPRPAPRLRRADKGVVLRFLGRVRGDICPGWLPSIGTLGRSSRASGPAVAASPASIAPRTWHYWPRPTAWGGGLCATRYALGFDDQGVVDPSSNYVLQCALCPAIAFRCLTCTTCAPANLIASNAWFDTARHPRRRLSLFIGEVDRLDVSARTMAVQRGTVPISPQKCFLLHVSFAGKCKTYRRFSNRPRVSRSLASQRKFYPCGFTRNYLAQDLLQVKYRTHLWRRDGRAT